jgi:NAD(P)-dependent dehydrogenase (short-subunit alcohol dehydrogenase family)
MDLHLRDRRAVVTGGSRGIGLQIARRLLQAGAERTPWLVEEASRAWDVDTRAAAHRLSANTAIGRSVTAAKVADVVTFLASPRSVAMTGDAVVVSGGSIGAIHY